MSEWIKWDEQIPERGTNVLTVTMNDNGEVITWNWYAELPLICPIFPTHWMYMEPPK